MSSLTTGSKILTSTNNPTKPSSINQNIGKNNTFSKIAKNKIDHQGQTICKTIFNRDGILNFSRRAISITLLALFFLNVITIKLFFIMLAINYLANYALFKINKN